MIIRATILVFALMFYMMVDAGGQLSQATRSMAAAVPSAGAQETAMRVEGTANGQAATGTERVKIEKNKERMSSGLLKIWPDSHPEAMKQRDFSLEGKMRLPLTDETTLHHLTYADAERAISEQFTGQSGAHGPQMKVRQALILGCGLMMREAREMGVEGRGKYEKLDRYRPMGDSSPPDAPRLAERIY